MEEKSMKQKLIERIKSMDIAYSMSDGSSYFDGEREDERLVKDFLGSELTDKERAEIALFFESKMDGYVNFTKIGREMKKFI